MGRMNHVLTPAIRDDHVHQAAVQREHDEHWLEMPIGSIWPDSAANEGGALQVREGRVLFKPGLSAVAWTSRSSRQHLDYFHRF
jgi:hypothetical protein